MSSAQLASGLANIGGAAQKYPGRKFVIQTKDFTSSEQAVPVRVTFGIARVAGTYITPIFAFRSEPITTKVGK